MQLSGAAPASSPAEVQAFLKSNSIKIDSPDGPVTPLLSFDQLAVPEELRSCFSTFKQPSPIQACTWPPSLQGKDVVGIAETGSGKTLAFGIPALVKLITNKAALQSPGVSILVVAPTRELALQTHDTLSAIGKPFKIASVAVFGGVPKDPQVKMLAKSRKSKDSTTKIIVGTPGRILDLCNDGACDLSGVDYLVLDEADRMLDKGFENDIRNIISQAKQGAERQTLMFSATWPESVRRLASSFLRTPVRVTVGSEELTANSRVEQVVEVFDDSRSKDSRLMALLRKVAHKKQASPEESRILVFGLYKKETARLEETLRRQGYSVGALHGDMAQTKRMEALDAFRKGETNLLVATDVAARGLDIPNVGLVVNYSFPLTIEDYVHRIGRTGRGGKDGKSITYFTGDNHERSLAGEFSRMLRDSGYPCEVLSQKFPMTIKKKEHSVYGAFFRDDIPAPKAPTKIVFD
ncbi:P-loop containing nucleoside triphosphate hydrolase protein [Pterulicium gracile]|uniref:RNA helicase n=1 Tax=Pterulicium gracile TaxID=1884261 RepID=A0A5C3QW73_9AGAR|nr:P-loop containing nucleoside triphosphate hydrolase protein [Pterula gracilis]